MADASFHKVISVFLASPDDLKDERRLTREIVDRLNKSLRLYGQHIDLYGWEDIAPGAGRAQGKINPFVDRCDLFVGVLHRRWGTPTGEFSSGFHEEYSRVRKRYEDTGCPDIALFFKYADEVSLDDPGPQLKQILAFRDSVKSEVYFRDFRDVEEWKNYIEQLLLERALHGLLPTTEAAGALAMTASPGPAATAPASAPTPAVSPRSGIPEQIGGLLEAVNAVLPTGALDLPAPDAAKLSEFQIARLHLLSTAISSNQLTGQLLEAQEANLLYKYKEGGCPNSR